MKSRALIKNSNDCTHLLKAVVESYPGEGKGQGGVSDFESRGGGLFFNEQMCCHCAVIGGELVMVSFFMTMYPRHFHRTQKKVSLA